MILQATLLLLLSSTLSPSASALPAAPTPAIQNAEPNADGAPDSQDAPPALSPREAVEHQLARLALWIESSESSTGEDLEVCRDQIERQRDELDGQLDALIQVDDPADLAFAKATLLDQIATIDAEIEAVLARIDELRTERDEAEDTSEINLELDEAESLVSRKVDRKGGHVLRLEELDAPEVEELKSGLIKRLEERARIAVARVQFRADKVEAMEQRVKDADPEELPELKKKLIQLVQRRDTAIDVLSSSITELEQLGAETDPSIKQARLAATGELAVEDVDFGVLVGLLRGWGQNAKDLFFEEGLGWAFQAGICLLILVAFTLLSRVARRLARGALRSSRLRLSELMRVFFERMIGRLVLFMGVLIALSQLGIELGPVLAGLGIAGFVLGFALQETLSNFASGLMILIYRPFDVGDVVSVAGVTGKVDKMSLVSTTILTSDNQALVVPNSKIWGDVITNITARDTRRVDMVFGIGYEDDIEHAEKILDEIVSSHELVLSDPEPVIKVSNLNDSSVDFVVRPWAKTGDYWDVLFDITRSVKLRFDEEGISIPFPQRDVHVIAGQAAGESSDGSELTPALPGGPRGEQAPAKLVHVGEPAPGTADPGADGDEESAGPEN